jgi:hypothetical protein
MEVKAWWVATLEMASIVLLGAYALCAILIVVYFGLQYRFLRYLQKRCPAAYHRLGRPDPLTRVTQNDGYFNLEAYLLRRGYRDSADPHALQMGQRLRETCLSLGVVFCVGIICSLVLGFG